MGPVVAEAGAVAVICGGGVYREATGVNSVRI